jgi:hypothetical protein
MIEADVPFPVGPPNDIHRAFFQTWFTGPSLSANCQPRNAGASRSDKPA